MKTLTKPEKFQTVSPRIYGYEEEDESSWVEVGRERITVWVEGSSWPACVSIYTELECQAGGSDFCTIGETCSEENYWGNC